jgi:hypothetical protein
VEKWIGDLSGDAEALDRIRRILASLTDADLETWGYPRSELDAQIDSVNLDGPRPKRPALTRYTAQRKLLAILRKNIHHNALGRGVRRIQRVCDVLMR